MDRDRRGNDRNHGYRGYDDYERHRTPTGHGRDAEHGQGGYREREEWERGQRFDQHGGQSGNRWSARGGTTSGTMGGAYYGQNPEGSGHGGAQGQSHHDEDYQSWREARMQEFDRDYEDFRRYQQEHFNREFEEWRRNRRGPGREDRPLSTGKKNDDTR